MRSKYQVVEGGLFSLVHCPTDVKIVDKLMLRLANQLEEDAEEMEMLAFCCACHTLPRYR